MLFQGFSATNREPIISPNRQHVTIETYATGENPYLNQSVTYTYDDLYRLTDADYESGLYFRYQHDAGDLLNNGESSYTYNSANRLVSVTKGETTSQYSYNGLGNRVQQIVNGVTTDYVLDTKLL